MGPLLLAIEGENDRRPGPTSRTDPCGTGSVRFRGQDANFYTIDWRGCQAILDGTNRRGSRAKKDASTRQPPASTRQPPASTEHPSEKSINYISSQNTFLKPSVSDSEADAEPSGISFEEQEPPAWLAAVPELTAAWSRRVAPLPLGDAAYGIFSTKAIKDVRLDENTGIVWWFRQQLSAEAPIADPREAYLLLVMACGIAVRRMQPPPQKSYAAVWCATVGRGLWRKGLPYVPEARSWLDKVQETFPECLTHPQGAGPRRESRASPLSV